MYKLLFLAFLVTAGPVQVMKAQVDKFEWIENRADVHTVYAYRKSNWDGSHASMIFLYVRDNRQLESFKYAKGDDWATLVTARIDPTKMTVAQFRNDRIHATGERKLFAELSMLEGNKLAFRVMDFRDTVKLDNAFWHSYDFDLASLAFIWKGLANKRDGFLFDRADPAMVNDKPAFVSKGPVAVQFIGEDLVSGRNCLKYSINGKGLEDKGGHIWIDPETGMIILYRIALPDEEGFDNGQLALVRYFTLDPDKWEQFIQENIKMK